MGGNIATAYDPAPSVEGLKRNIDDKKLAEDFGLQDPFPEEKGSELVGESFLRSEKGTQWFKKGMLDGELQTTSLFQSKSTVRYEWNRAPFFHSMVNNDRFTLDIGDVTWQNVAAFGRSILKLYNESMTQHRVLFDVDAFGANRQWDNQMVNAAIAFAVATVLPTYAKLDWFDPIAFPAWKPNQVWPVTAEVISCVDDSRCDDAQPREISHPLSLYFFWFHDNWNLPAIEAGIKQAFPDKLLEECSRTHPPMIFVIWALSSEHALRQTPHKTPDGVESVIRVAVNKERFLGKKDNYWSLALPTEDALAVDLTDLKEMMKRMNRPSAKGIDNSFAAQAARALARKQEERDIVEGRTLRDTAAFLH